MLNEQFLKRSLVVAVTSILAACGGGSDNVSPGSIVVEVPVDGGGGDLTDSDGDGVPDVNDQCANTPSGEFVNSDGCSDSQLGGGPGDGETVASIIPDSLSGVITDSGQTAGAAFGNRPIFTIDVSALPDGVLDPTGLLIGNDAVMEITGGALRVVGGTLEMAPGAVISGGSQFEFVVIEQGAQIDAQGTADQPIIFTAAADVAGEAEASDRGLWGGLVINGFAPINDCPEGAEGGTAACTKEGEANSGTFGGDDPNDSSGTLRYVQVRYAGSNVDPENQLNGIAFQGVGSGTTIEYVQVHNNLDDGIEFFGGTASGKYIVLTGHADDSLDWTDGWTGALQYVYIEQTDSADNIIEADNREGDENVTPRSNPVIANFTAYGNPAENALRIRRGTGLTLTNAVISGSDTCLRVDGASRELLGTDLVAHLLESIAFHGRFTLHAQVLAGHNDHHKVEALFKALGRALDAATRHDARLGDAIPSTKGVL